MQAYVLVETATGRATQEANVLVYDPARHPDPEIAVGPSAEVAGAMEIRIDGALIAHVMGYPQLTPADIMLKAQGAPRAA